MDLTNFTSTSLGYIVAFLLPGISAIYAASLYSHPLRHQVDKLASVVLGYSYSVSSHL
jgi:hypothetical protein